LERCRAIRSSVDPKLTPSALGSLGGLLNTGRLLVTYPLVTGWRPGNTIALAGYLRNPCLSRPRQSARRLYPGYGDLLGALSERRNYNRIAERQTTDVERLLPNSPTF
jgi:hypothetical protein